MGVESNDSRGTLAETTSADASCTPPEIHDTSGGACSLLPKPRPSCQAQDGPCLVSLKGIGGLVCEHRVANELIFRDSTGGHWRTNL